MYLRTGKRRPDRTASGPESSAVVTCVAPRAPFLAFGVFACRPPSDSSPTCTLSGLPSTATLILPLKNQPNEPGRWPCRSGLRFPVLKYISTFRSGDARGEAAGWVAGWSVASRPSLPAARLVGRMLRDIEPFTMAKTPTGSRFARRLILRGARVSGATAMPMYCNIARAALRPAPMARMTVAPPVHDVPASEDARDAGHLGFGTDINVSALVQLQPGVVCARIGLADVPMAYTMVSTSKRNSGALSPALAARGPKHPARPTPCECIPWPSPSRARRPGCRTGGLAS